MIHNFQFQSNQNNQEILPFDYYEFPYVCNTNDLDSSIERRIPWHWHPEMELDYIEDGTIEFHTPNCVTTLSKGSMIFINTNIMHDIRAKDHSKGCQICAHIFDISFLSGTRNSLFEQKYLLPLIKNQNVPYYVIQPDSHRHIKMIDEFLNTVKLNQKEPFGYEFEVRFRLSRIWCLLLEETKEIYSISDTESNSDTERLKIMMQYIHEHFMDKISINQIALSANVSPRECTRCFKRCMKLTPIHYLNEYRLRMAAQMLVQTHKTITDISQDCGFSSSSYFAKTFFNAMGCTPKKYRKKKQTPFPSQ